MSDQSEASSSLASGRSWSGLDEWSTNSDKYATQKLDRPVRPHRSANQLANHQSRPTTLLAESTWRRRRRRFAHCQPSSAYLRKSHHFSSTIYHSRRVSQSSSLTHSLTLCVSGPSLWSCSRSETRRQEGIQFCKSIICIVGYAQVPANLVVCCFLCSHSSSVSCPANSSLSLRPQIKFSKHSCVQYVSNSTLSQGERRRICGSLLGGSRK